tara:strand:- start:1011 stop:1283 length:273 start_codon:yes stop_codon:yes gene_type:complete
MNKSNYDTPILSLEGGHQLVARFNLDDRSVEILDLETVDMGWTCYDSSQGASSDKLTKICDKLSAGCLLQALGLFEQEIKNTVHEDKVLA